MEKIREIGPNTELWLLTVEFWDFDFYILPCAFCDAPEARDVKRVEGKGESR